MLFPDASLKFLPSSEPPATSPPPTHVSFFLQFLCRRNRVIRLETFFFANSRDFAAPFLITEPGNRELPAARRTSVK